MRRFVILVSLVMAVGALGCGAAASRVGLARTSRFESVTKTRAEVIQDQRQQGDVMRRQLVEDIDSFWMADRPSRLTEWHVR